MWKGKRNDMFIVCHSVRNVHSYVKMVTYTVILDITRMHFARVCAYSVLSNVAAAEDPCQIFTSNIEVVNILFFATACRIWTTYWATFRLCMCIPKSNHCHGSEYMWCEYQIDLMERVGSQYRQSIIISFQYCTIRDSWFSFYIDNIVIDINVI